MKIKRSDFSEETIYVVDCPNCGELIEMSEDPTYEDYGACDHCQEGFDIED